MKNNTVEEIEAIMKEAEDVEINVRDSECVFVPKTWLYSKLTTLTQHHQDEKEALHQDFKFACGVIGHLHLKFGDENEVVKEMKRYISERDMRGIDISDKTETHVSHK